MKMFTMVALLATLLFPALAADAQSPKVLPEAGKAYEITKSYEPGGE